MTISPLMYLFYFVVCCVYQIDSGALLVLEQSVLRPQIMFDRAALPVRGGPRIRHYGACPHTGGRPHDDLGPPTARRAMLAARFPLGADNDAMIPEKRTEPARAPANPPNDQSINGAHNTQHWQPTLHRT